MFYFPLFVYCIITYVFIRSFDASVRIYNVNSHDKENHYIRRCVQAFDWLCILLQGNFAHSCIMTAADAKATSVQGFLETSFAEIGGHWFKLLISNNACLCIHNLFFLKALKRSLDLNVTLHLIIKENT